MSPRPPGICAHGRFSHTPTLQNENIHRSSSVDSCLSFPAGDRETHEGGCNSRHTGALYRHPDYYIVTELHAHIKPRDIARSCWFSRLPRSASRIQWHPQLSICLCVLSGCVCVCVCHSESYIVQTRICAAEMAVR